MTRSNPEARQRLVAAAADLLRRRGLNATSVRTLAVHARAPLGSTYHYFPGGKPQLVTEAIQFSGDAVLRGLSKAFEAGPVAGLCAYLAQWRELLIKTDFRAGCPVLAVAVEEPADDDAIVLAAAAEVFAGWERLITGSLQQHGVAPQRATQLATLTIAAVEGAIAICRAKRSAEPFDLVAAELQAQVAAAIPTAGVGS